METMKLKYYKVPDGREGKKPHKIMAYPIGGGLEIRPIFDPEHHCVYSSYQLREIDSLIKRVIYHILNPK